MIYPSGQLSQAQAQCQACICLLGLCLLLMLPACAQLESKVRDKAPTPVNLQDVQRSRTKDKDTDKLRPKPEEPGDAAAVLDQLQERNDQFNARMASIMDQSGPQGPEAEKRTKPAEDTISGRQEVALSFYQADLVEVVRVFMDLIDGDYVLHSDVEGQVSLSVEDAFSTDQLVDLLQGVLRINNMIMLENPEGMWEIMPMSEASGQLSGKRMLLSPQTPGQKRGQIIQVFSLHYIAATELIKIIKPYLSRNATVYAHDAQGILLICDYPHVLDKVDRLSAMFDESVFADVLAKVFTLKYAQAEEAVDELQQVAREFGLGPDQGGPNRRVGFVPLSRTNTVVAVARDPQVMDFVSAWVQELDTKMPTAVSGRKETGINVYYVQYGDADNIVEALQGLFQEVHKAQEEDGSQEEQSPVGQTMQDGEGTDKEQGERSGVSGELSGAVTFQVDMITNSILTRCNRSDYDTILSVIEKLDLYPKQVLIEMVIAEVQLNDSTKLGVEWNYLMDVGSDATGEVDLNTNLAENISSGLSYVVENTNRLTARLKALAEDNQVQILSTPTLLASDNKEATINIGDEVPIPTSTEERYDDTSTARTETTTLQYRDTGIILDVTPKINKHGMVRLEISQEVSNRSDQQVEGITAPIISTRNTSTSVAVNDGQTIVIGGLIKQTRQRSNSGVPYLRNIPWLGSLFRYTEESFDNTELIVFITPHVVLNEQDSDFITKDFKLRLKQLKEVMM
ncbi:MAG: type II secretion system secretin GspD [Desulfovermiculus sp.]